jgi:hypothetical protein
MRLSSRAKATQKFAETPSLFCQIAQPKTGHYLFVPGASSQNRAYVPMGFMDAHTIVSNLAFLVPGADLYTFGVMESAMHMHWLRYTSGRIKSDYRYAKDITYNNFPWPESPSGKQKEKVEKAAQAVLDIRQLHLDDGQTFADLYDALSMPKDLLDTHRKLDEAVDRAYRPQPFTNERNRMKYLFALYRHYTEGIEIEVPE